MRPAPSPSAPLFTDHFPAQGIPKTVVTGDPSFNAWGYRCQDFDAPRADVSLMFLGCSWVQDYPEHRSFTKTVCDLFEAEHGVRVAHWNLGLGASGMDYVARTVLCTVDVLKPDAVFFVIPGVDRREYYTEAGRLLRFQLDWTGEAKARSAAWKALDADTREAFATLGRLANPMEHSVTLLKDYKLVEMSLNSRGIPWGFSMVPPHYVAQPVLELLAAGWMDPAKYLGCPFEAVDYWSETDFHPGEESRRIFGTRVYDWFWAMYPERFNALCHKD